MQPQWLHVWLVYCGGTAKSLPPCHASLYVSCRLNSTHPCSSMALFKPDLACTFRPGASTVPEAERDIFRTFKSSMTTTAWFLLIAVEVLCRKSARILAIFRCRR